jgi:hypothetical protein
MAARLPKEIDDEVVRRLMAGQTIRGIAREMGVSRGVVSLRRRKLARNDLPGTRRRSKYQAKRFSDPPPHPQMASASMWEKVIELAIRDGDLAWFVVRVQDRDKVGSFTWTAIMLGMDPEDALAAIMYREERDPVFPRRGDGSVILWDWTDFDIRETRRNEKRDAAGRSDEDVAGPEAPGVEGTGVRGCDGRPRWDEGGRQDACGVGA